MAKEQDRRPEPSIYPLHGGFGVEFDPSKVLPPDRASEVIGAEAADVLNAVRIVSGDPQKDIKILELGVGAGVGLLSALQKVKTKSNITIHGIDSEDYCVETTQKNIYRLAAATDADITTNIWKGDWFDPETWDKLRENKYHAILFNPPYLPKGEDPGEAYAQVPPAMMFTDDAEGMQHYRHVMPKLGLLLSEDEGSSILVRRSSRLEFSSREFRGLLQEMVGGIGQRVSFTESLYPVEANRLVNVANVTRTDGVLPPHKDARVVIAMQKGEDVPVAI